MHALQAKLFTSHDGKTTLFIEPRLFRNLAIEAFGPGREIGVYDGLIEQEALASLRHDTYQECWYLGLGVDRTHITFSNHRHIYVLPQNIIHRKSTRLNSSH